MNTIFETLAAATKPQQETFTYIILRDGKEVERLTNQINDVNLLGRMLRLQSNSFHWAVRYEGWKVIEENELTGERKQTKAGKYHVEFI